VTGKLPSDTFKIWKKGTSLRFDSSINGMGDAQQKISMSFLFTKGSLFLIDHDSHTVKDALSEFRNPSYDKITRQVASMLRNDLGRSELKSDKVHVKAKKTMWGSKKKETVMKYECDLYEMQGLEFSIVSRASQQDDVQQKMPEFSAYFNDKKKNSTNKDKDKKSRDKVHFSKQVDATLWLSTKFPLSVKDLIAIMELISPVSKELGQLKRIVEVKLPAGFPVKIGVCVCLVIHVY